MRQPTTPQSRVTRRVLAVALTVVATATTSIVLSAAPVDSSTSSEREQVRRKRAEVAARLNVLKADDAQIHRALDAIEANVSAQQARVASARQAALAAERSFQQAQQAEQAKQQELDQLRQRVKSLAVDAYINPTTSELAATLNAKSLADATRKRELLEFRMNRSGDLVDRLAAAREDLGIKRQEADAARTRANERKQGVESQLAVYQRSLRQQLAFAEAIEAKVDAALAEADGLTRQEAAIRQREEALAAAARASRSGGTRIGRGGNVSLTTVRGITVASSIADNLEALLAHAESDGYSFSGGGYRDPSDQVAVRRSNCGTSDYAIYEMPASQCSPPTAKPGSSMHEQGLAVDFSWQGRIIGSRSSPAFQWLARNAARYGFYNLPSEPWHWSTNGN